SAWEWRAGCGWPPGWDRAACRRWWMTPWTRCCPVWRRSGRNWRPRRWGGGAGMARATSGGRRAWEPFGVTEADFAAVPERHGMKVVNVTPGHGEGPGQAGWWLRGAATVLALLAAAAAAVSWQAQYVMVRRVKHAAVVAAIEAGIPDAGAVVF